MCYPPNPWVPRQRPLSGGSAKPLRLNVIMPLCLRSSTHSLQAQASKMGILLGRLPPFVALIAIWAFLLGSAQAADDQSTTFVFNRFNGTGLILTNSSSVVSNAIRLTTDTQRVIGRAVYSRPVRVRSRGSANGTELMSFSTTFVFAVVPDRSSSGTGGQGVAFIMTPFASAMGALPTQYLGLLNFSSDRQAYNHLFAVEFDTVQNPEFKDIDGNHVGVDLNTLQSTVSRTAGYWSAGQFRRLDLHSGRNIQAWIDYEHGRSRLNVTIAPAGSPRPARPLISQSIDLADILEEHMYVGFSASTGTFVQEHYILAWSFSTKGTAPALDVSHLRSFLPKIPVYQSIGFIAGITLAAILLLFASFVAAAIWLKRIRDREFLEEWELEYWPHRFSYKELSVATKGFGDPQLLGSGGFGKVYWGVIPSSGLQVAVKCINKEVTEGMKEFIAEISSMGRLQHRNLVRLRGWCRKSQQLFIVYDYMANGSLDGLIFGNPPAVLRWPQRYRILKGVAAGLLYLHDQWEKKVVHRDVKSSNVLLDSEFNARVGDFGLARLYDHTELPHTTHVVGTLGYIAPELIRSGKASPSSDVFSFGIVLLEVACGRRPLEPSLDGDEIILLEWVRELYAQGRVMDAADPKLEGDFDGEEMQRVLQLGLFCTLPEPQARLTMAHVLKILDGEAPLPALQVIHVIGSSKPRRDEFGSDSFNAHPDLLR